jgi:hypothetical protein
LKIATTAAKNSCCCFTGHLSDRLACAHCNEPRFKLNRKPHQQFRYIRIPPRIKAGYLSSTFAKLLKFRSQFTRTPGEIHDVYDGAHYLDLCNERVVIDGEEHEHCFFSEPRDVALGFMLDGFQIFKRRRRGSATCWPLIAINFNLPPEIRTRLSNVLPLGIIPGPMAPKDYDSFLHPFINECKELAAGIRAYDAEDKCDFTLHVYPISCHGDMPAIKHVMHFKGPNGMVPCRGCEICGVRDPSKPRAPYYVPLNPPTSESTTLSWDPAKLPLRTKDRVQAQISAIESATSNAEQQ